MLDEPTTLPGERLLTWVTTKSDDLTDEERRALHERFRRPGNAQAAGLRPASEFRLSPPAPVSLPVRVILTFDFPARTGLSSI